MSTHPTVVRCLCPAVCPVPHGYWIATNTPVDEPYPCRCGNEWDCRRDRCPCSGRIDTGHLPDNCCAKEAT